MVLLQGVAGPARGAAIRLIHLFRAHRGTNRSVPWWGPGNDRGAWKWGVWSARTSEEWMAASVQEREPR